jgi:DNA polymerase-3 subunit alpha (Gram-positive type)
MNTISLPKCLNKGRVVVVDVETTGFKPEDRVIEVGVLWIEDCEVVMDFSKFCNPGVRLPDEITKLTGITQEQVDHAEPFSVIADMLIDVMGHPSTVVAYNSSFDFRFLRKEVEWCGKELKISSNSIDPLPWVRNEDRGKKCSLTEVAKRRGVDIMGAHRALDDCYTTVGVLSTIRIPDTLENALAFQRKLGNGLNGRR